MRGRGEGPDDNRGLSCCSADLVGRRAGAVELQLECATGSSAGTAGVVARSSTCALRGRELVKQEPLTLTGVVIGRHPFALAQSVEFRATGTLIVKTSLKMRDAAELTAAQNVHILCVEAAEMKYGNGHDC